MKEFLKQIITANSGTSSKRLISLYASLIITSVIYIDVFTAFVIPDIIYYSLITMIIGTSTMTVFQK